MFQNLYGDHKNSQAVPVDIKTPLVMSPAWLSVCVEGRVRPLWWIKQAPEEIQGGNTQCKHSERKSLWGCGNTIPQESGYLLYWGDIVSWGQQMHYQGQGHQVQGLLVRKWQRHCWFRSICGRRVDKVFEVQRVSDRIILVKLIVGQHLDTILCVSAPQWSSDEVKDIFFDQLGAVTARIRISDPMRRLDWPCRSCRQWI